MKGFESWLLSYLLNSIWQTPLLFAAGWIAARALRRAGAVVEHRAWVTALALQSLLPALSTMRWDWLGKLFAWGGAGSGDAHVTVVMGAGTTVGGLRLPATVLAAIALAYGATFLYFAARFGWRWRELGVLRRDASEVTLTGNAADCWGRCARRFGVDGAAVAVSDRIYGPVTMGFRKKLVLLPAEMLSSLNEAELHTVAAHEFAHMRRNDFAKNLIYGLLALPVSYDPLSRLTRERVTESREVICDQMAAEMSGRIPYARSLLRLAGLLAEGASPRIPQAIGIFDTKTFERRLMRLAKERREIRGVRRVTAVIACVAFGLAACGSALAMRMHVDAGAVAVQGHATTAPKSVSVSPGVMAGNRIGGDNPKYPAAAKKAKIEGTVVLAAFISKDGSIKKLTVVSGPNELRKSATDAVRTWKYKPFLLNGNPVEVKTKINIVYSLAG